MPLSSMIHLVEFTTMHWYIIWTWSFLHFESFLTQMFHMESVLCCFDCWLRTSVDQWFITFRSIENVWFGISCVLLKIDAFKANAILCNCLFHLLRFTLDTFCTLQVIAKLGKIYSTKYICIKIVKFVMN